MLLHYFINHETMCSICLQLSWSSELMCSMGLPLPPWFLNNCSFPFCNSGPVWSSSHESYQYFTFHHSLTWFLLFSYYIIIGDLIHDLEFFSKTCLEFSKYITSIVINRFYLCLELLMVLIIWHTKFWVVIYQCFFWFGSCPCLLLINVILAAGPPNKLHKLYYIFFVLMFSKNVAPSMIMVSTVQVWWSKMSSCLLCILFCSH